MRAGQYVKCVASIGREFLEGNYYLITRITPTNGCAYVCGESGIDHGMFIGNTQFELAGDFAGEPKMQEPEFDLEDMELAEILMEEMKCRDR